MLTLPESPCKFIHFLQVYVFASPTNTDKIVLWYSELWYRVWYVGTDNLVEHTGFFFRGDICDTTKFHKFVEFLRVNTSPSSVHWTAYNNHTPHKRKPLPRKPWRLQGGHRTWNPPSTLAESMPAARGTWALAWRSLCRVSAEKWAFVARNWCVVSVGGLSSRYLPEFMYKKYELTNRTEIWHLCIHSVFCLTIGPKSPPHSAI